MRAGLIDNAFANSPGGKYDEACSILDGLGLIRPPRGMAGASIRRAPSIGDRS